MSVALSQFFSLVPLKIKDAVSPLPSSSKQGPRSVSVGTTTERLDSPNNNFVQPAAIQKNYDYHKVSQNKKENKADYFLWRDEF